MDYRLDHFIVRGNDVPMNLVSFLGFKRQVNFAASLSKALKNIDL
jgi:hypothetical protein